MKKIAVLLFFCMLLPWSVEAKDKVIDLKYIPRDKVKVNIKNVSPLRIYFEEVEDNRSQPKKIGENLEDKRNKIQILTSDNEGASQFMGSVLKNEFREKGFTVEEHSREAQKIIRMTLEKFWTLEERNYNSEAELKIEVREKSGESSFKRTYSTTGTNSGRSLSEVNYNESFSDAAARMVEKLFSDSDFLRVLAEKPKPPRVEEKQVQHKGAEDKRLEEKRLEELKAEVKRLEEIKAEERRAKEKQVEEKRAEEKRLEEIKAEEKRLEERKAKEKQVEEKRAEEKRLEEIRAEVKRLEEKKADEKRAEEKRLEGLKAEEKRLEEIRVEVKRLEELKAVREAIMAEEKLAEEKKREAEKRAREKRPAPAKPKPVDPAFGPK